ncbi:MAG: general secretion pathway protein GspB [Comamonadaceae bacterium]|nr:general secretion pathway protein GspB [Comamonadaceae bacterium]
MAPAAGLDRRRTRTARARRLVGRPSAGQRRAAGSRRRFPGGPRARARRPHRPADADAAGPGRRRRTAHWPWHPHADHVLHPRCPAPRRRRTRARRRSRIAHPDGRRRGAFGRAGAAATRPLAGRRRGGRRRDPRRHRVARARRARAGDAPAAGRSVRDGHGSAAGPGTRRRRRATRPWRCATRCCSGRGAARHRAGAPAGRRRRRRHLGAPRCAGDRSRRGGADSGTRAGRPRRARRAGRPAGVGRAATTGTAAATDPRTTPPPVARRNGAERAETGPVPATAPMPQDADAARPRPVPFDQLPAEVRRSLPPLAIGGAVWSENAASRMLLVGGQLLHEGDAAAPGITLERIGRRSAVLRRGELRWEVGY